MYDDAGTLVSGSFVDYLLPTAADTISFDIDHTTTPSTTNTLGTKGVGEAGTIASTPAVVNAVVDAVRHLGVNDIQMPCTPERVWKAINGQVGGGPTDGGVRRCRTSTTGAATRTGEHREGAGAVIPAAFDYVAPTTRRGRARRPRRSTATTPRSSPAGRACCRCSGCGSTRPSGHRPRQDRVAARHPRRRRRDRDRRDDAARRGRLRPAGRRARLADRQGGRAPRRRAGPAPRHLRRRARARRPGRRPGARRRWRSARSS